MGGFKGQRRGFTGLVVTTTDNTTWGEEEDELGYGGWRGWILCVDVSNNKVL